MDCAAIVIAAVQTQAPSLGGWCCCGVFLLAAMAGGVVALWILQARRRRKRAAGPRVSDDYPAPPAAPPPLPQPLPFRRKEYFFTKAEVSFYLVLRKVVGDKHVIFPHVRVADLVYLPRGADKRQAMWNTVSAKHVDFVLCDSQAFSPVLVIELDDSSHERPDRQERDEYVDQVFRDAGLPLLRVPAAFSYNTTQLAEAIAKCTA